MSAKTKGRGRKAAGKTQENVIDSTSGALNGDADKSEDVVADAAANKKQVAKRKQSAPAKKSTDTAEVEKIEEVPAKRSRGKQPKEVPIETVVETPQVSTKGKRGAAKKTDTKTAAKQDKTTKATEESTEPTIENGTKPKGRGRAKSAAAAPPKELTPAPSTPPAKQAAKSKRRGAGVPKDETETSEPSGNLPAKEDDVGPSIKKRGRGSKAIPTASTKVEPEQTAVANDAEKGKRGRGKAKAVTTAPPPPAEPIEENGASLEKTAKKGAKKVAATPTPAAGKKRGAPKKNLTPVKEIIQENGDHEEADHEEIITEITSKKRKMPSKKASAKSEGAKMNATDTDYSKLDFSSDKEFNLKISSWNIAGLRAWIKKNGLEYLQHEKPDILCLQEIKCVPEDIPDEARLPGYHPYWLSKPGGQAGVAIYSKIMPINVEYGLGDDEQDEDGRILTAEYEKFFLVCVYVPNAGRMLVTLPKRLRWNKLFEAYLQRLNDKKPVIICGDMNVAHTEIDLANPKTNKKNAGFTQEERDGMTDLLSLGYVDTLRHFYPDQERAYTFWAYFMNARAKDVGWRLDYFLVSERLMSKCVDNIIRSKVLGSDHCPITLLLNL